MQTLLWMAHMRDLGCLFVTRVIPKPSPTPNPTGLWKKCLPQNRFLVLKRLGTSGLSCRNLFSQFWRLEVQDQAASKVSFSWGLSPWRADGYLLWVLRAAPQVFIPLLRWTSPVQLIGRPNLTFCGGCLVAKLCPTLLWTPGLLGISQARILEWVATSFSRESSWPRDQTHISCVGRRILYHGATRKAHISYLRLSLFFITNMSVIGWFSNLSLTLTHRQEYIYVFLHNSSKYFLSQLLPL